MLTYEDIPSQLPELSASKRELLEKRLRGGFKTSEQGQLIRRRSGNTSPLSFAQQRLWLIDQLDPESDAYNVPMVLQVRGELDYATLEKALNEILRRHEVLRA